MAIKKATLSKKIIIINYCHKTAALLALNRGLLSL